MCLLEEKHVPTQLSDREYWKRRRKMCIIGLCSSLLSDRKKSGEEEDFEENETSWKFNPNVIIDLRLIRIGNISNRMCILEMMILYRIVGQLIIEINTRNIFRRLEHLQMSGIVNTCEILTLIPYWFIEISLSIYMRTYYFISFLTFEIFGYG